MLTFHEFKAEIFLTFAGIRWLKQATLYLLGHHKSRSLYDSLQNEPISISGM